MSYASIGYLDYEVQEKDTIQLEAPLYIEEVHGPKPVCSYYKIKFCGGLQNSFGYMPSREFHGCYEHKIGKNPENISLRSNFYIFNLIIV